MNQTDYYKNVAAYFDDDASDFEARYQQNPVLKRLREEFRAFTELSTFQNVLEIGCGPGIDLIYFGRKYPNSRIFGIDISEGMVEIAQKNIREQKLENVRAAAGSIEKIEELFPGQKFDLIYVYFGALNTVYDLRKAADILHKIGNPEVKLVLTFVNRFYLMDIPMFLMSGRFKQAFARLFGNWKGYSPHKTLNSRCYSAKDIKKAFSKNFNIKKRRGFSIFYPAWYRYNHLKRFGGKWSERFWKWDEKLSKTPLWNTGEYSLYVMENKSHI